MDLWDNALVKPPFAANPPFKVNVNAKTYGLVIGILAVIGAVLGLIGLFAALTFSSAVDSFCNTYGTCATHTALWLAIVGALVGLVGLVLAAWGGFQMYNLQPRGRSMIVYGMVLGLVGDLLYLIGWGFGFFIGSFIIRILIYAVIYYFLVISRFPNEAPLTATGAPGYGQQPPYGQPPYGQQPYGGQQPYPQNPQQPYPQNPHQPPTPPGPPPT